MTARASTDAALSEALNTLAASKDRWARLPVSAIVGYLAEVRARLLDNADDWVAAGSRLKGFPDSHPSIGAEEWLGGPYPTTAWLTDAIGTLEALRAGRDPLAGLPVTTRDDGQVVLTAFPATVYDRLLLHGYELDIWMQPGVSEQAMRASAGRAHRQPGPSGRVRLVLGAGNVSAIPVLDAMTFLVNHREVVLLKLNPISEAYGPVFERILEPLVRDGFLRVVYGGGDVGEHLVRSAQVDAVHITGSAETFDAIVWGSGPDAENRRARGEPLLSTPISAELGGVGPTIVVPGEWSDADVAYQAEHVATQKLHSAGHTCVASQVLVLPAAWPARERFVEAVRAALVSAPHREPFYPATAARVQDFVDAHGAEVLTGNQAPAVLRDVDPDSDHPAFVEESFGPMYVITALPGATVQEYLRNAVRFANERLAGDLGANLIVDPQTARTHAAALDGAEAGLRYGCIGINAWAGVVFLMSRAAWGPFAGNTLADISSGNGVVHNALMLEGVQKNVVRAPFRPFPRSLRHRGLTMAVKPPWFLENATSISTARQFTFFAAAPSPAKLPGLFASALRG